MSMRTRLSESLKESMKSKKAARVSTLRLINAAIKDRDIAARNEDNTEGVSDQEILAVLGKMVKQRQESARTYDEAGRIDLAEREREEIEVIEEFLPKQLSGDEINKAIAKAIEDTGASSIRDMGKVMGDLKGRYTGQMYFGKVGPMVKSALS